MTAEVPTLQLREKTITIATFSGFCVGVLVTYISPFLQNPGYADLEGKIGFIWGVGSVFAFVWCFFVVPELKGRTLEELDELFAGKVGSRAFKSTICYGYGAQLSLAEKRAPIDQDCPEFLGSIKYGKADSIAPETAIIELRTIK